MVLESCAGLKKWAEIIFFTLWHPHFEVINCLAKMAKTTSSTWMPQEVGKRLVFNGL